MNFLTAKKSLDLTYVPSIVADDFEAMVLESYFDSHWFDLHSLTYHVDMFAVYALSEEQTGSPFTYPDNKAWMDDNSAEVIADGFYDIMHDVGDVLDYHHMFHAWKDIGDNGEYVFIGEYFNMPIKEVW
jgi:hypothetical protein